MTEGNAVKALRGALGGITQERFARQVGTTTRTVARWESLDTLPPHVLTRLRDIAINVKADGMADFFRSKLRERWE